MLDKRDQEHAFELANKLAARALQAVQDAGAAVVDVWIGGALGYDSRQHRPVVFVKADCPTNEDAERAVAPIKGVYEDTIFHLADYDIDYGEGVGIVELVFDYREAPKIMVYQPITVSRWRHQMEHAIIKYDDYCNKRGPKNIYRIGIMLDAMQLVLADVERGVSIRRAIAGHFNDRLRDRLLRAVGEPNYTRDEYWQERLEHFGSIRTF